MVAITGRCRVSMISRQAAGSPLRARSTSSVGRSITASGRRGVDSKRQGRSSRVSAPCYPDPGTGSPSHAVRDQVLVVGGLAEPVVDQLLVDGDLLAAAFVGLERQFLEALLEDRHQPPGTDVL